MVLGETEGSFWSLKVFEGATFHKEDRKITI